MKINYKAILFSFLLITTLSATGCSKECSEFSEEGINNSKEGSEFSDEEMNQVLQMANYCVNIQDAENLGVVKLNNSARAKQTTSQKIKQVFVKTTSEYSANDPNLNSDGTLNVTFTKIDTTETTTIVNGEINIIASRKAQDTNELNYQFLENEIILSTDTQHEYRVLNSANQVQIDWFKGDGMSRAIDNLTINEQNPVDSYKIEIRSLDAYVSFKKIDNCTYSLFRGEKLLKTINSSNGEDAKYFVGKRLFVDGLVEGEAYSLKYTYSGTKTEVKQSEIGAEIDKLYVYNEQFTFMSFVPAGTSKRPNNAELVFDDDGIAQYDKCDYFSNKSRLSFVVDNNSGLIYQIKDFKIKNIRNHLIIREDDKLIYDFKIENDNLVIYSVFSNSSITVFDFFKDKFGNNVICNNKLNTYDVTTNTTFYVENLRDKKCYLTETIDQSTSTHDLFDSTKDRGEKFFLTSDNRLVHYKISGFYNEDGSRMWNTDQISDVYSLGKNSEHVNITEKDNFYGTTLFGEVQTIFVKNGHLIIGSNICANRSSSYNQITDYSFYDVGGFYDYDCSAKTLTYCQYGATAVFLNYKYLAKYDIALAYFQETSSLYYCHLDNLVSFAYKKSNYLGNPEDDLKGHLVFEDVSLDNYKDFLIYGVDGNEYYDVVVEERNGEYVVNKYITGTYVAPQIKIILQPIR